MENKLTKKYGLFTAICMVVGIVVGSGVFFKAQNILNTTNGDMPLGIIAWLLGGVAMLICILTFATMSGHYEKCNGIVDYAEETVGKGFAYYIAWFSTFIYYPGMTSALAWLSARYTVALFGGDITGGLCMTLSCFYLCLSYTINVLSPKLAGKFQVSTTVIKFIPLLVMAVGGTIFGLINGQTADAFSTFGAAASTEGGTMNALFASVVATAFAYEGWIIATSINSEIKNSKKNLPIALTVGGIIIILIYSVYYIGIAGAVDVATLREQGANAAFENMFGAVGGKIISALIVVSCLGTLNGLMVASTRGMYSIAVRNQGPDPETISQVDKRTNMPGNAAVIGLIVTAAWLFYFYGANLHTENIFGLFGFDSSELPIITIYGFYIPIFIMFIKKKGLSAEEDGKRHIVKNFVMPSLAVVASAFMVFAALYSHGITPYLTAKENGNFSCPVLFYLIIFAVILIVGSFFYKKERNQ